MSLLEFCEISTKWLFSHRHFIDKLILLIVTKPGNTQALFTQGVVCLEVNSTYYYSVFMMLALQIRVFVTDYISFI